MKAEIDQVRARFFDIAHRFDQLDPQSFGYKPLDRSAWTAMLFPDLPTHAQHLDCHRLATLTWDKLRHEYGEIYDSSFKEGERDNIRLRELVIRVQYCVQDLADKLDMLRKLKNIRDETGSVGAT